MEILAVQDLLRSEMQHGPTEELRFIPLAHIFDESLAANVSPARPCATVNLDGNSPTPTRCRTFFFRRRSRPDCNIESPLPASVDSVLKLNCIYIQHPYSTIRYSPQSEFTEMPG